MKVNLKLLTDEEVRAALEEIRQIRTDLDALQVRRDAVHSAMAELEELDEEMRKRIKSVRAHLKDAL